MKDERLVLRQLLALLKRAPLQSFPKPGGRLEAPDQQGVYVIYGPQGRVVHVGRTPRAKNGLAQRLRDHLHGSSSFSNQYLGGDGSRLRKGYAYRVLVVRNRRHRALLEAFAVGSLCPKHLGLG